MPSLENRLEIIRAETDQNRKNLLVAEVVSELLRAIGAEPVVVGGSAVEFYTDGAYVSADVDVCFDGPRMPTPRERETVLAAAGQSVSIRSWNIAGVMVDLLGRLETSALSPLQTVGKLRLIQIEDLIAERILVATVPAVQRRALAGRQNPARRRLEKSRRPRSRRAAAGGEFSRLPGRG